jgi:hypothetical protein
MNQRHLIALIVATTMSLAITSNAQTAPAPHVTPTSAVTAAPEKNTPDTSVYKLPKALNLKQKTPPGPRNWLQGADDDAERWNRLELATGGFATAMVDISGQYQKIYAAINDRNFELASYHWERLVYALAIGSLKRSRRTVNSELIFSDPLEEPVRAALKSGDLAKAQAAFLDIRTGCMACHAAEKVAFMNDQALFRTTARFTRSSNKY